MHVPAIRLGTGERPEGAVDAEFAQVRNRLTISAGTGNLAESLVRDSLSYGGLLAVSNAQ